ncbi:MAG: hypothetical protein RMJ84_09740 [Sandaracinaceae bacterium]|nr:hypothetical protein [Sandaracinaceae bacterium]
MELGVLAWLAGADSIGDEAAWESIPVDLSLIALWVLLSGWCESDDVVDVFRGSFGSVSSEVSSGVLLPA